MLLSFAVDGLKKSLDLEPGTLSLVGRLENGAKVKLGVSYFDVDNGLKPKIKSGGFTLGSGAAKLNLGNGFSDIGAPRPAFGMNGDVPKLNVGVF